MALKVIKLHELGMTQEIISTALRTARENGAKKVLSISLEIGSFTGLVDENIKYYFDLLKEGPLLSETVLKIKMIPLVVECSSCEGTFEVEERNFICKSCGGIGAKIISGKEQDIKHIEIES